jgi:ceramide glucosyltransferase
MIETALWAIVGLFLLLQLPFLLGVLGFRRYVRRALDEESGFLKREAGSAISASGGRGTRRLQPHTPKASMILPCKGIDPGFAENVRSIIEQRYPDFEIIFVTATADDPARESLGALLKKYPSRKARLVVAGIQPGRSQKLNNQLAALEAVRPESEVLVFLDSDIRAQPTFLLSLVEPLGCSEAGATKGFRWYIPEKGGVGSYLRATWNGGGVPILAQRSLAYAWGGAMAMRKSDFVRAGIREKWATALTDDFPLTDAVRNVLKSTVVFVPRCLVPSHEDASLRQTLEWTNRQTIICRVYNPKLWSVLFASHAVQSLALLAGAALVAARLLGASGFSLAPVLLLFAAIPVQIGFGMLLWQTVRTHLLPGIGGWGEAFKHALLVPAAIFLIFCNSVHSLCTRVICWRGVKYRLHSATHTEVLAEKAAPQV